MSGGIEPIRFLPDHTIEILDQMRLPAEEHRVVLSDVEGMCEAIRSLRVRGAPLLGICGAAGIALGATAGVSDEHLRHVAERVGATRPTAVDLGAAVTRALDLALRTPERDRREALWANAKNMLAAQQAIDDGLATHGAALPGMDGAVLTHCNTGALATGARGTALAVVDEAWRQGRLVRCFATETRPLLQGARLTAWELLRLGIPATLLPDTAVAALAASGEISAVVTGADRVAANGDSANKIGTYGLALAAARHALPFYIAAPTTTIDAKCPDGAAIPIEHRAASEVGGYGESRWSPNGIDAYNPAFDVTPADLITAIVTEHGVLRPPYVPAIKRLMSELGRDTTGG